MLGWMISVYGVLIAIYLYFYGFTIQSPYKYIFAAFFILDILPALLVHFQYLSKNNGAVLTIDRTSHDLTYKNDTLDFKYQFGDIEAMEHVASYGGGSWYSFSEYRYFKIQFKDKNEIYVTCLMISDIKNVLETILGIQATKKLRLVAFIK
jgi:hypothetical protein